MGDVGRLLLAMMLKERCRLSKPWLYMSEYFEKHRDEYAERLFNVSARNEWTEWIEFCLLGVVSQAEQTINRCERLRKIREAFEQRLHAIRGTTAAPDRGRHLSFTICAGRRHGKAP